MQDLKPYCCFEWGGRIYRWNVLPFGISIAPRSFSKIMKLLVSKWREEGIRCSSYIDDMVFFFESEERALEGRARILRDLERFGLAINADKAHLMPSTCVTYLGYELDSAGPPTLFVPEAKVVKLLDIVAGHLRTLEREPEHQFEGTVVASLVGKLLSMRYALAPARVMTRGLIATLRRLPGTVGNVRGQTVYCRDYQARVTLTEDAVAELLFWKAQLRSWNGLRWASAYPDYILYTDG